MLSNGMQSLAGAVGLGAILWAALFRLTERACRWVCLTLLACLLVWMVVYRSQQLSLHSDVPVHIAMIEREARLGMFAGDPFFANYPTPLHYSPLHVIGGWMMRTLGSTAEGSWIILGLMYAVFVFVASLVLGLALFQEQRVAWVQALLTTCWLCLGDSAPTLGTSSALAVLLAVGLILRCAQRQELGWLSALLIAAVTGFAMAVRLYPGVPGYVLVLVLLAAMWRQLNGGMKQAKYVVMIVGPILLAWPWLQLVFVHAQAGSAVGSSAWHGWGEYWLIHWGYLKKLWLWQMAGPGFAKVLCPLLAGLGAVLLLTKPLVSQTARRFLAWMLAFLVFLWIAPLELTLAGAMTEDQLGRMADIFGRIVNLAAPMAMAFGVIVFLKQRADSCARRWSGWTVIALGCLVLLSLGPASRLRVRMAVGHAVRPRLEFIHKGKPVFDALRGKVVLSDAWTSYLTQHALGTCVVAIPLGHSSEMVDIEYRRHCIGALFSGGLPRDAVERLISRYGVDYILVNKVLARGRPIPNLEVTAPEYEHFDPAYLRECGLFRVLFEDNDVLLLAVQHG